MKIEIPETNPKTSNDWVSLAENFKTEIVLLIGIAAVSIIGIKAVNKHYNTQALLGLIDTLKSIAPKLIERL